MSAAPDVACLLAEVEDRFGWWHMRPNLKRALPDWGVLVDHCRRHRDTDARCQYALGRCHLDGDGVAQDEAEAVRLFLLAADQRYAPAELALGVCHANGQGVAQDWAAALQWYRRAAAGGSAGAECNVGFCYAKGNGVAQDEAEAAHWFLRAAEAGDMYAHYNLGVYCRDGRGVARDQTAAARWFRRAAMAGHTGAQNELGICFHGGRGVEQNLNEALRWFSRAAAAGHVDAQNNLVACYPLWLEGRPPPRKTRPFLVCDSVIPICNCCSCPTVLHLLPQFSHQKRPSFCFHMEGYIVLGRSLISPTPTVTALVLFR
eukprot:EG_transcript_20298